VASFHRVKYRLEKRAGLDFARNTGARAATGSIIAYTDDDAVLHPLWTCYIKKGFSKPEIMAVTGLIIASELKYEAQVIFEEFWSFNRGYLPKEYSTAYFNQYVTQGVRVWEIGAGANMAFRKEIFEQIGYFDERLDVGAAGCNGDSEFWYRILAEGYSVYYTPLAIAYHLHRKEMKSLKKQIFYYMRGFAAAEYIQYERYAHRGNLHHLYNDVLLYYLFILPKAIRRRFRYNFKTYWQEIAGILSGIRFYHNNKNPFNRKHLPSQSE
jgi:GT2 family glycosyltransferase